jgi:endonuclease/exonuclease/phosphatase family metal-dependent hydrolase
MASFPPPTPPVTLVFWNVLAPTWCRQDLYPMSKPEELDLKIRSQLIASRIREIDADVLILQEIDLEFCDTILGLLNTEDLDYKRSDLIAHSQSLWSEWKPLYPNRLNGGIVLWKSKIINVKNIETINLTDDGNNALGFLLEIIRGENRVSYGLIGCHLEPNNAKLQNKQVSVLLDLVSSYSLKSDGVILCGDFNLVDTSIEYTRLLDSGLIDIVTQQRSQIVTCAGQRIDYIFASMDQDLKPMALHSMVADFCSREDYIRKIGSDHLPVGVKIFL